MTKTILEKIKINSFRGLQDVEIELGNFVTVICGKNGTSKSTILGIAAQIFSFEKDYEKEQVISFATIEGGQFKSLPSEHFRISEKFDKPNSMDVDIQVFDGYTNKQQTAKLGISRRADGLRFVVRNNSAAKGNKSRNFTHPVIFLSLQRLLPITKRDYKACYFDYLNENKNEFISLNNELLNKRSSEATGTSGSISSAVSFSDKYDQDSVSSGEDNAGQIILALMSFKKLQSEYPDYKGGILLIDEADAGLFPAAQTKLIDMLNRECRSLNIQVVMTSHSPTLIEHVYNLSKKYRRNYKTLYLSDTYGPIKPFHDFSWQQIYSDLLTITVPTVNDESLPKVNVYFEDAEAYDFFKHATTRKPFIKYTNPLKEVSLGCKNYMDLVKRKIPEFYSKSIIVLDGDTEILKTSPIVKLPTLLPPDKLIFEYLYNLSSSDEIWKNKNGFTKKVFTSVASDIISALKINSEQVDLSLVIAEYIDSEQERKKKLREIFKSFYKNDSFQGFIKINGLNNPWKRLVKHYQSDVDVFVDTFKRRLVETMQKGYGIDVGAIPFAAITKTSGQAPG